MTQTRTESQTRASDGPDTEPLDVQEDPRENITRQRLIEDVLRAVRTGSPPVCRPEDGVDIQRIADAIEHSATTQREVTI